MRKTMITYAFFSIVIGIFIYFFTVIEISNLKTNEAYLSIANDVSETYDVTDFVRFSSQGFERLETFDTDTYKIDILHVLAFRGEEEIHQFGIFVIPKDDVKHATVIDDPNDQTKAYITTIDTVIYDSSLEDTLGNYAVSVGIEQIGFYFYAFEFDQTMNTTIVLNDFDGNEILNTSLNVPIDFDTSQFMDGFSDEELNTIINSQTVVETTIVERLTIYILVVVVIGTIIYYVIKAMRKSI
jgi:hypothetical protein